MPDMAQPNALHPRIEELLEHLEETRAAFLTAVAALPAARRATRTAPGRWSLGELVEHVQKVEMSTVRVLTRCVARARAEGATSETDTSSIAGMMDGRLATDRTRRLDAPPIVVPAEGASVDDALAALAASRVALRAALLDANGLALGTITYPHPAFGLLNMYQWGLLLGWHDLRHADQVREMNGTTAGGSTV